MSRGSATVQQTTNDHIDAGLDSDLEADVALVHPDLRDLCRAFRRLPALDPSLSIEEIRAATAGNDQFDPTTLVGRVELAAVEDLTIPVGDGVALPARLYRPAEGDGRPGHVHFHGGGFCTGSVESADPGMRLLAAATGANLLSVGYRLAPEHPWPTGPEDCYAAVCWAATNAERLGASPNDLTIGGDSAGANLAAVVSLMIVDRGGPSIAAQLLNFGSFDLTMPDTPSMRRFGSGFGLDRDAMARSRELYLPDPARRSHRYASPLRTSGEGVPPTVIDVGTCDPLYDDGVAYATHLAAAGVPVRFLPCEGHLHATISFTGVSPSAGEHIAAIAAALGDLRDASAP
jgi:acetyl esterase